MAPKNVLRGVAALFVLLGYLLLKLDLEQSVPRDQREVHRAPLADFQWRTKSKTGESCLITLEGDPTEFAVQARLERQPALRAQLVERLAPGADIELECAPRDRSGWTPTSETSRPILRLTVSGAYLYDSDSPTTGATLVLRWAVRAFGLMVAVGAAVALALTFRPAR